MNWLVFALLSVIGFSLANLFRKIVMKDDKTDAIASAIVFQFLAGVLIGIFALYKGFIIPPFAQYPMNFFLAGFLWALAAFLEFKAFHYLEASEAVIISTLQAVVVIVAAHFFLKEIFTLQMIIGTLLILTGVIGISKRQKKMTFNRGIAYILGFCFFGGLGVVNDTFMVKHVNAMSYLSIGFLLPVIFLMLLRPASIGKIREVFHFTNFKRLFFLTLFYTFGSVVFVYAILNGAQVSQLSPISNASIILTVLLATIFLGERDHLVRKCISTILVFVGVLLLS